VEPSRIVGEEPGTPNVPDAPPPADPAKAEGRRKSLAVWGGVMAGAGTLIASMVGLINVFGGDEGETPPPAPTTTVASSTQPSSPPPSPTGLLPYASFTRVEDDTGTVSIEVPAEWTNVRGDGFNTNLPPFSGNIGAGVNVSPDVAAWFSDLTTPGVFAGASIQAAQEWDPEEVAVLVTYGTCVQGAPRPVLVNGMDGVEVVSTCGDSGATWHTIGAWPQDHAFLVLVQAKVVHPRDQTALDRVLTTLRVLKTPPA
jgi:hypothetical protein